MTIKKVAIKLLPFLLIFLVGCNITRKVDKKEYNRTTEDKTEKVTTEKVERLAQDTLELPADSFDIQGEFEIRDGEVIIKDAEFLEVMESLDIKFVTKDNKFRMKGNTPKKLIPIIVNETIERTIVENKDVLTEEESTEKIKESKTSWTIFYIVGGIVLIIIVLGGLLILIKQVKPF